MSESVAVHKLQAFKDLNNDSPHFVFRQWCAEVSLQIAMREVFHSKEYIFIVLIPTMGLDEAMLILRDDQSIWHDEETIAKA